MAARKKAAKANRLLSLKWDFPPYQLVMLEDRYPAIWIMGHRLQEVVGEAQRSDAIALKAVQLHPHRAVYADDDFDRCIAISTGWLVPEPTNPHDPGAIAVYVDQVHVGYLSREAAPRWRDTLQVLHHRHPGRRVACTALIMGCTTDPQNRIGVWLLLDTDIRKAGYSAAHILGEDDLTF